MLPINYLFTNQIYSIYMYEQDLALADLQELICRKTERAITFLTIERSLHSGLLVEYSMNRLKYTLDYTITVSWRESDWT